MPILLNKISAKGGGGQKSLKSCLRRKSMTPYKYFDLYQWVMLMKYDHMNTFLPSLGKIFFQFS